MQTQHHDPIETILTTGHALVAFGIDYLLAQGLDVPRETLERVIWVDNDRPIHMHHRNGREELCLRYDDVDHHDDEALNELYYDRLQAFTTPRDAYESRTDRLVEHFKQAVQAHYGGQTVTFARGPYRQGRYLIYVIIDHHAPLPEVSL